MITANTIKKIKSLANKKHRKLYGEFIAEGEKVIQDILAEGKFNPVDIYSTEDVLDNFKSLTEKVVPITQKELERISSLKAPNKVVGVFEIPDNQINLKKLNGQLILALDGINDPGNLGTIVRIADWFGIKNIICSNECVDLFNPKVVQATMGSISRVNVFYSNLSEILPQLKSSNTDIFGTFLEGENIYKQNLPDKGIILIGSESHGISEKISQLVNRKIHIPSFNPSSNIDSLNASIATALVCSEFRKQNP